MGGEDDRVAVEARGEEALSLFPSGGVCERAVRRIHDGHVVAAGRLASADDRGIHLLKKFLE